MSTSRKSRAFTLLEMTLAMTITAITGLSVAGATMALCRAHQNTEGFYQSLQTTRSAMLRIQRTIQNSKLVTANTGTTLVLWVDDTNGNRTIDADEVLLLVFDTAAREVRMLRKVFPPAAHDALNVDVPLSTLISASTVLSGMVASAYTQTTVLASDAVDFFASASPAPPMATRVDFRLSVGSGKDLVTLRSSASTRGGLTAKVTVVHGSYVLLPG